MCTSTLCFALFLVCGLPAPHTCSVIVSHAYLCVMSVTPLPKRLGQATDWIGPLAMTKL